MLLAAVTAARGLRPRPLAGTAARRRADAQPGARRRRRRARGRGGPRLPHLRDEEHDARRRRRRRRQRGGRRPRGVPGAPRRRPAPGGRARRLARLARRRRGRRAREPPRPRAAPLLRRPRPAGGHARRARGARPHRRAGRPAAPRSSASATSPARRACARPTSPGRTRSRSRARVDAFHAATRGRASRRVLVVVGRRAGLRHARRGLGGQDRRPRPLRRAATRSRPQTRAALRAHHQPRHLRPRARRGRVPGGRRAACARSATLDAHRRPPTPIRNAIAFARFADGSFGWGVVDPGHGLVFAHADRPLDARRRRAALGQRHVRPAAAARGAATASGRAVEAYLLDIQPGYRRTRCAGSTITAGSSGTTGRWG